MLSTRARHTATLLGNGQVLIVGGEDNSDNGLFTAELYDPPSDAFTFTGGMAGERALHTATLLQDGKVLVVGGIDKSGNVLASAELYH